MKKCYQTLEIMENRRSIIDYEKVMDFVKSYFMGF